eukprot:gene8984-9944_t
MSVNNAAPDSWENIDQSNENVPKLSGLSVSAKPFVPNVNAAVFVPSFARSAEPEPESKAADSIESVEEKLCDTNLSSNGELEKEAPASWDDNEELLEEENETMPETLETTDTAEKETEKAAVEKVEKRESPVEVIPTKPSKKVPEDASEFVDMREHVNVIFIGHVDAGKSTIGGHLLFLTGQVDKRTLEKYEREAKEKNRETWYLSWALDTNLEERDKGKTVEVGRASFDTPSKHFVLLDAPGHKSFVPNMIGGAAQADLGVLVISARKGEFETGFDRGGQTREHAMLAKTAGVKHLVVLVNKMDDSTVTWDEGRYKEIESKLGPFLKKSGFRTNDVTFMPCSGFTGANLKDTVDSKICPWYKGPSFLDLLDQLPSFSRPYDGPVKILVSDRYKDMGTIVIGKIESGTVRRGETFTLMPNKHLVKVMNIIGTDESEKNSCKAGENVKLKLSGVEEEEVVPGFIICSADALCSTGRIFEAQVVILEHKSIICPGYTAVLHIHNAVEEVTLVALVATLDKKTGERSKQRPRFVKQDQVCIARLKTSNLICMETFAKFQPMGRFTLRDEGKTIAIGKVLKIAEKREQQSTKSLAVGSRLGYKLYTLNTVESLEEIHSFDKGDVCIVERLFSSSLVAIVNLSAPRKLKVCHFKKGTEICNYSYPNTILAVKLNRVRLLVALEESLYIHNIRDMKVLHTIRDTPPNPNGLCVLSSNSDNCYLAYPGSNQIGEIQVFDAVNLRPVTMIPAHDSPVASLSFNNAASLLATASEKGTVIRVFSIPEGQKLFEFRRGVKRCAHIYSLSFSTDSLFLTASSNTETVHIFRLEAPKQKINKLPRVMVASEDGHLYIYNLDPEEGGDCSLIRQHKLLPDEGERSNSSESGRISAGLAVNASKGDQASASHSSPPYAELSGQSPRSAKGSSFGENNMKLNDESEYPPLTVHND